MAGSKTFQDVRCIQPGWYNAYVLQARSSRSRTSDELGLLALQAGVHTMTNGFLCPVCGYEDLLEPAWDNDSPSDDICPSCGTQFGYDDFAGDTGRRQARHRELRERWKDAGCPWSSPGEPPPEWDPARQLAVVEDETD